MTVPPSRSQRKKDLIEVMRRARVFGLQGTPRPSWSHLRKLFNSPVVMSPSIRSGGK